MTIRRATALVVVLCLAACGGTQSAVFSSLQATVAPTATSTPTASPAPTPSPTVDPAAAGRAFLAAVAPLNALKCSQVATQDLEVAKGYEVAQADALRVLADVLRQIAMPADLEDDKQDLLHALAASEQAARFLADSATTQEFDARSVTADTRNNEAAAISNFIRAELGLESTTGGC